MIGKGHAKQNHWYDIVGEERRTYVFPHGEITIENPKKLMIKMKPEGHSHRIIGIMPKNAPSESDVPVSYYIPSGWMAIRWDGIDGTEHFGW